jgi:hypothetical protein
MTSARYLRRAIILPVLPFLPLALIPLHWAPALAFPKLYALYFGMPYLLLVPVFWWGAKHAAWRSRLRRWGPAMYAFLPAVSVAWANRGGSPFWLVFGAAAIGFFYLAIAYIYLLSVSALYRDAVRFGIVKDES